MKKKSYKKIVSLLLCAFLGCSTFSGCGNGGTVDTRDLTAFENSLFNLAGTDAVGRNVERVDGVRDDSVYVGMWYSFWHGQHPSLQTEVRDIQKLLDQGETGKQALEDKSDVAQFYYWGEPLYGYYNSLDPFVLSRHIELFIQAGIDFLLVDCTNQYDYYEVGKVFLDLLLEFQDQGFNVPKIGFYTNTESGTTVDKIYKDYYVSGRWESLWFKPNGRPLIVGITENNFFASDQTKYWNTTNFVSANMQAYFEVKESQWPNGVYNENGMPWMSWSYPQEIHNGYTSVAVAQHDYETTYFSSMSPSSHRGYNNITQKVEGDWKEGLSFQMQWDSLFERQDDISTVFICCWNEWIAQKQPNGAFIDVYNWEYSRDLEMMKGGYGDNYYMQLVKNVRDFKYTEAKKYKQETHTIDVDGDTETQWENVKSQYKDLAGDARERNFVDAAGKSRYIDTSARNDITDIAVTHDSENIYFRIQTKDDITEYNGTDKNWMNLLISVDSEDEDVFAGYQYIINRTPSDGVTSVEKSIGGYDWEEIGTAQYRIDGNVMTLSIPLSTLKLSAGKCNIQFKVADNVTNYDDIMDYYVTGDCAPLGRLNYVYGR